jgi:hypothetical protein
MAGRMDRMDDWMEFGICKDMERKTIRVKFKKGKVLLS